MAIADQISSFLTRLGQQSGQLVAGSPGKFSRATTPAGHGQYYRLDPGTKGILERVGLSNLAQQMQYSLSDPTIARNVGAGVLGAGVIGAGAAGTLIANKTKKKPLRMAGDAGVTP
jgi:hypothetical protein